MARNCPSSAEGVGRIDPTDRAGFGTIDGAMGASARRGPAPRPLYTRIAWLVRRMEASPEVTELGGRRRSGASGFLLGSSRGGTSTHNSSAIGSRSQTSAAMLLSRGALQTKSGIFSKNPEGMSGAWCGFSPWFEPVFVASTPGAPAPLSVEPPTCCGA